MNLDLSLNTIVTTIIVGGVAGFLANLILSRGKGGLFFYIIIGIIGAVVGNQLFYILKISIMSGIVGQIITATIGALILLILLRLIKR
jgi:uncharacterized membrane protein YeaQ/YmgE (transglycosylase-associated protein family)